MDWQCQGLNHLVTLNGSMTLVKLILFRFLKVVMWDISKSVILSILSKIHDHRYDLCINCICVATNDIRRIISAPDPQQEFFKLSPSFFTLLVATWLQSAALSSEKEGVSLWVKKSLPSWGKIANRVKYIHPAHTVVFHTSKTKWNLW